MKLTLLHRIKLCCEILTTRSGHGRSSHEKQLSVFQRGYDAGFRDVRLKHDYIEKMARENKVYVEGEDIYKEYRCGERVLKQFAEAYAAKALEDKERELAELKEKLTTELKRGGSYKLLVSSLEGQLEHYRNQDYTLAKARLDTLEQSLNSEREMNEILTNENTELQAHINDLREALERLSNDRKLWKVSAIGGQDSYAGMPPAIRIIDEALAETPAKSLQEHDNEVIERCAKVLEQMELIGGLDFAEAIRALKGGKWQS